MSCRQLHDPTRLVSAGEVDWSAHQLRALRPGQSSRPHICDRLVWVAGLPLKPPKEDATTTTTTTTSTSTSTFVVGR